MYRIFLKTKFIYFSFYFHIFLATIAKHLTPLGFFEYLSLSIFKIKQSSIKINKNNLLSFLLR